MSSGGYVDEGSTGVGLLPAFLSQTRLLSCLYGYKRYSVQELEVSVSVAWATGAVGKKLVPRLVEAGHEVHGMTRHESNRAMLGEMGQCRR